ncbi:MAG: universal stress protein [Desulfobacterales bacterium]|nr:universal stress protein [Desulfobacterales bacterium]
MIMGTHGHGKLEEAFVGSVAREVIRRCPVPVMVVRLPESRMEKGNRRRDRSQAAADAAQIGKPPSWSERPGNPGAAKTDGCNAITV